MLRIQRDVVSYWAPRVLDYLPIPIREACDLIDLPTAINQAHFPNSMESLTTARRRLAFDEVFLMQIGVLLQKRTVAGSIC